MRTLKVMRYLHRVVGTEGYMDLVQITKSTGVSYSSVTLMSQNRMFKSSVVPVYIRKPGGVNEAIGIGLSSRGVEVISNLL
jgi:hypothetical protein